MIFSAIVGALLRPKVKFPELGENDADAEGSESDRFPVVVRGATKEFLAKQAVALRTSLAGAAGLILDHVARESQPADQLSIQMIAERLRGIIRAHGISTPAAAELLQPYSIGLPQLADDNLLYPFLTTKTLADIATLFRVNYQWLVGLEQRPARNELFWDKSLGDAVRRVLEAYKESNSIELILVAGPRNTFHNERKNGAQEPRGELDEIVPVLVRQRRVGPETFETYECWDSTPWDYERTRIQLKLLISTVNAMVNAQEEDTMAYSGRVQMTGYTLEKEAYDALRSYAVLPVTLLKRPGWKGIWHPCDYVEPSSSAARDTEEWIEVMNWEDSRRRHQELRQMVSKQAAAGDESLR